MIKHIVMLRLNQEEGKEQIKLALEALPDKIPEIKSLEVGLDVSSSNASYDLVLVTTFENIDALDTYRVHPEHKKVVAIINEVCSERAIVDYEI